MLVLQSTKAVVDGARHVRVDDDAIVKWARGVSPSALSPSTQVGHSLFEHLPGTRDEVANLILLIDALNFCFWSSDPIRIEWRGQSYERFNAMLVSLMLTSRHDPRWFDPAYWLEVPREEIQQVLSGRGELLMMNERERIIRETGRVLLDRYDGRFSAAVDSVNGRAWPLAVLLMTNFDSFRDVGKLRGRPVYFLKRAQICAVDLSTAWSMRGEGGLEGLEELTAFADYRVPQALRELGIIVLSPELGAAIEAEEEIGVESEEEIEIRAATIQAVDRMVKAAGAAGKRTTAWRVDWYLWGLSHEVSIGVKHHRTRTIFY